MIVNKQADLADPGASVPMIPSLAHLIQSCWHHNAAQRPTMYNALLMLENSMMEAEIYSTTGIEFWSRNFLPKGVTALVEILVKCSMLVAYQIRFPGLTLKQHCLLL